MIDNKIEIGFMFSRVRSLIEVLKHENKNRFNSLVVVDRVIGDLLQCKNLTPEQLQIKDEFIVEANLLANSLIKKEVK